MATKEDNTLRSDATAEELDQMPKRQKLSKILDLISEAAESDDKLTQILAAVMEVSSGTRGKDQTK